MECYRVISNVVPSVEIEGGIHFSFQETDGTTSEVYILPNEISTKDGKKVQIGWTIINDLFAEGIDDAMTKSGAHVDGLLSCASLISGVSIDVVEPEIIFNTKIDENNVFFQFIKSGPIPSRRKLNGKLFVEIIEKIREPPHPEYSDRIMRAIRWFRMGTLVTKDVLTSYDCFWKGLESLNKPLAELLDAPQEYNECSKCGNTTKRSTSKGIKKYLKKNYPEGDRLFKQFNSIRVKIVHSTEKISTLLPTVLPVYQKLALILYEAILFILGIDVELKYSSLLFYKTRLAFEGEVKIASEEILKEFSFPILAPQKIEIISLEEVDDQLASTYEGKYIGNIPDGYALSISAVRLYGQEITGFKVQGVEVGKV